MMVRVGFYLLAGLLLVVSFPIFRWLFVDAVFWPVTPEACLTPEGDPVAGACWPAVMDTLQLLLVGRYPAEHLWRVGAALGVVMTAAVFLWFTSRQNKKTFGTKLSIVSLIDLLALGLSGTLIVGHPLLGLVTVEPALWGGLLLTVVLSVVTLGLGSVLGLVLALGRMSPLALPRWLATIFIETVRGVPLITVLFFALYVFPLLLPAGASTLSEFSKAALALVLFEAAYFAEVFRSGLSAVPQGQHEAAKALGLTAFQRLRFVALPQALKISLPTLIATTVGLVKDTALVSVIGMFDLLGAARNVPSIPTWLGKDLEPLIFAALFYLVLSLALDRLAKRFEHRRPSAL